MLGSLAQARDGIAPIVATSLFGQNLNGCVLDCVAQASLMTLERTGHVQGATGQTLKQKSKNLKNHSPIFLGPSFAKPNKGVARPASPLVKLTRARDNAARILSAANETRLHLPRLLDETQCRSS